MSSPPPMPMSPMLSPPPPANHCLQCPHHHHHQQTTVSNALTTVPETCRWAAPPGGRAGCRGRGHRRRTSCRRLTSPAAPSSPCRLPDGRCPRPGCRLDTGGHNVTAQGATVWYSKGYGTCAPPSILEVRGVGWTHVDTTSQHRVQQCGTVKGMVPVPPPPHPRGPGCRPDTRGHNVTVQGATVWYSKGYGTCGPSTPSSTEVCAGHTSTQRRHSTGWNRVVQERVWYLWPPPLHPRDERCPAPPPTPRGSVLATRRHSVTAQCGTVRGSIIMFTLFYSNTYRAPISRREQLSVGNCSTISACHFVSLPVCFCLCQSVFVRL